MEVSKHVKLHTTSGSSYICVRQLCHGSGVLWTRQRSNASIAITSAYTVWENIWSIWLIYIGKGANSYFLYILALHLDCDIQPWPISGWNQAKRNRADPKNIRERPRKTVPFKSLRRLPPLGTVGAANTSKDEHRPEQNAGTIKGTENK